MQCKDKHICFHSLPVSNSISTSSQSARMAQYLLYTYIYINVYICISAHTLFKVGNVSQFIINFCLTRAPLKLYDKPKCYLRHVLDSCLCFFLWFFEFEFELNEHSFILQQLIFIYKSFAKIISIFDKRNLVEIHLLFMLIFKSNHFLILVHVEIRIVFLPDLRQIYKYYV